MISRKSLLVALILLGGLGTLASAQQVSRPIATSPTYPGAGTNGDYYSITGNFGNYGLPGSYPGYKGYGFSGYGPGAILNEYFVPWPSPAAQLAQSSKPAMTSQSPTKPVAPSSRAASKTVRSKKSARK